RADAESVLPRAVAEAAIEEMIEVGELDAVEQIERPQRIAAGRPGLAQHAARAAEPEQLLRIPEEALARVLQDRIELRILGEDALGVVIEVVLAADVAVVEQEHGIGEAFAQRGDQP